MGFQVNLNVNAMDPGRSKIVEPVLQAALQAADPYEAVRRAIRLADHELAIGDKIYMRNSLGRVIVVGFGKASLAMAAAAEDALGSLLSGGVIISKHLPGKNSLTRIKPLLGNHPIPAEASLNSTEIILVQLTKLRPEDLVLCLISGGGSALLTMPAAGISLTDLQQANRMMLACGASIQEINTLRKHIDDIKGGGLWRRIQPARSACLILSDVVGDPLDTIASGPMTPDSTSFADAWAVIERYQLENRIPGSIKRRVQAGMAGLIPETLKATEYNQDRTSKFLVGSNRLAAKAAVRQGKIEGFDSKLVTTALTGEARQAGELIAAHARNLARLEDHEKRPVCLVFGGETTVTITGDGFGGRNQETALAAVAGMAGLENMTLITLATDGEDGPTSAAGAVVSGDTLQRAARAGLNPSEYLNRNDSYHFFEKLGDLLITGPSGTNVNDLSFLFAF